MYPNIIRSVSSLSTASVRVLQQLTTAAMPATVGFPKRSIHMNMSNHALTYEGVKNTHTEENLIRGNVEEYYGKVLQNSGDLKTNACTTSDRPNTMILDALRSVPKEVTEKYYGCGSPLPTGITGLDILDLGSGSGQDCYIAAALVGENGSVTGIDMTAEQLDVARRHAESYTTQTLGYNKCNMDFKKGYIEDIEGAGISPESKDIVISNCVINLSPDKYSVLKGVYDALKWGGEFYFSDVYADRRVPGTVQQNELLWGECISGALYVEDFKRISQDVGFTVVRELARSPLIVDDPELKAILGPINFYSISYRLFKVPGLETLCEDYGQVAYYKGTILGNAHDYKLDNDHVFETGRPMIVCGNTAAMVQDSWLRSHFEVHGNRDTHYGLFKDCGSNTSSTSAAIVTTTSHSPSKNNGGGCC